MSSFSCFQGRLEAILQWIPVRLVAVGLLFTLLSCASDPEPTAISLVDRFADAVVENRVEAETEISPSEWRFDGESGDDEPPNGGWQALHGIEGLQISDGQLVGRVTDMPLLLAPGPADPDPSDFFHALEIELRVSSGTRLGVDFDLREELEAERLVGRAKERSFLSFNVELEPGDELRTYTLSAANAILSSSFPLSSIRRVLIRPTDSTEAEFEIASMQLVTLKEHLAGIPSGIGWHGLGDVFRETLVSRTPERITFALDLPSDPFLDLAIGTVDDSPVTFRVEARAGDDATELLRRTVSTPHRWHSVPVELGQLAGRGVDLSFTVEAERPGTPAFWGTPVVRNRNGRPRLAAASSPSRESVIGRDTPPPQGVILVIADTLRRDHLQPYGYERANAPVLTRLAGEGVLFLDAIVQGTWTKVSVSSIVTSLYPSTHGIKDMPDRMSAGVTTLAEAYRSAGYATFATSSVPFTGKLTNLHQGVEVLHESTSVPELDHSDSKTSRTYTDRLFQWMEEHREVPFFAFLHVFDPHSPFEPYRPYDSLFLSAEEMSEHRRQMEKVMEFIESDFMRFQALPNENELEEAGLDKETFIRREKAWYDASIRAMDVEIGRLVERLEELGLADKTLIAFVSDHGEEFLEHGRRFHGYHAYGEMLNVPLALWWPGGIPAGIEVEQTVQSIDLMPTLLELSGLEVPERVQGQSLLPLLADSDPRSLGWRQRPAFAERSYAPAAFERQDDVKLETQAVIHEGWKLIRNTSRPEDWPEYELYDHVADPLNLENVADAHPDKVEELARLLDGWQEAALAARIETEQAAEDLSAEEIQKLRSLGYLE
jgi:arylsulfatase A-like enzyme